MRSVHMTASVSAVTVFITVTIGLIFFYYNNKHQNSDSKKSTIQLSTKTKKKRSNNNLPLGVINVGNSCYLSSVLQLLAASGDILADHFEKQIHCPVVHELTKLLKKINLSETGLEALKPHEFIRSFSGSKGFSSDQQDAHEFLLALLNLPAVINSKFSNIKIVNSLFESKKTEISQLYKLRNPFSGLILTELICLPCAAGKKKLRHISSIKLEPFSCISLTPIESSSNSNSDSDGINEIVYKHFCVPERYSDYTNFNYLGLKCGNGAVKQKSPLILPEILFLHISLLNSSRTLTKSLESIKMELELSGPGYRYLLMGVIVHFGNYGSSGHFICYRKHQNIWFECNDANVRTVSEAEVLNHQAYILSYTKQH